MDLIGGLASRLRAIWLRARGVRIEGHCWLRSIEVPRGHAGISLGNGVALDRGVTLLITDKGRIRLGEKCYVNRYTMIDASEQIEIGAGCMIGPFCYITDHDHDPADPAAGKLKAEPARIGDRCWIGAHVTILKGVSIGDGAVIGAGAVVTKSIPPGMIAAGNPARIIRSVDS